MLLNLAHLVLMCTRKVRRVDDDKSVDSYGRSTRFDTRGAQDNSSQNLCENITLRRLAVSPPSNGKHLFIRLYRGISNQCDRLTASGTEWSERTNPALKPALFKVVWRAQLHNPDWRWLIKILFAAEYIAVVT